MQLEEMSEIAFRDLLLDLESYVNPDSLEPEVSDCQKTYTIALGPDYKWTYVANWEIECTPPEVDAPEKTLLKATLLFEPLEKPRGLIKLPYPEKIFFEYFIEKKPSTSQREDHGAA